MRACLATIVCLLLLTAGVLLSGDARAATLTVDGDASDWGFSVADNNASTFSPAGGLNLAGIFVEDSDDLAGDGGSVGPNLGGQNYDAEAMAVAIQGSDLFIVIATGQRPDNGLARYGPGDLRIITNAGDYGLEIGGGAGGGSGTMLVGGEPGSTYTLDPNGFTTAHNAAAAGQTAGSLWLNPAWILDPIVPQEQTQMQIGGGGSHVGDATYRFTRDSATTQHAIIEMSIPLSLFGGETIQSIVWHPACGNDILSISPQIVPEPGSMILAGIAAAVLVPALVWRRRTGSPRASSTAGWGS
jgi:hypothetical protein